MRPASVPRRAAANPIASAMTPMIDVVFLLLVFFLCTASFDEPEQNLAASLVVDSEAAGSDSATADETPPLDEVSVIGSLRGARVRWTVNQGIAVETTAELKTLLARLAEIDKSLPVTLDADPGVPLGDVVTAYDAARTAGFGRVLLVASQPAARDEAKP